MKHIFKAFLVGGLLVSSTAVFASTVTVTVLYDGAEMKFRRIDNETTPVCTFKRMVAEKAGLKMKKFDLYKGSTKLQDRKMLKGHNIYSGTKLNIRTVSNSRQCT